MDRLKTIFATILGIPENSVSPETSPQNTPSWDSLNAIVLITEIEKAYDIRFSYDEAMGVHNYGEAVTLVKSKLHA